MGFESIDLTRAQEIVAAAKNSDAKVNRLFFDGDHWQKGEAWTGPKLDGQTVDATAVLSQIERAFVSKNVIREVVERHRNGVVGREPVWSLAPRRPLKANEQPTQEEQALIDEGEAALTEWVDERGLLQIVQDYTDTLCLEARGLLRLYVPPGLIQMQERPLVPEGSLTESLMRLYVEAVSPGVAAVYTDPWTARKAGVYIYSVAEQERLRKAAGEMIEEGESRRASDARAEVYYVDEATGDTVFRVLGFGGASASAGGQERLADILHEARLPLGGALPLFEEQRRTFITQQVRENQKALNKTLTMMGRNADVAGFLERTLLNAQLPGSFEETESGGTRFVPDPLLMGPGITNTFAGLEVVDLDGTRRVTTPSVVYRDPVSPSTFIETKSDHYRNILEEVDQIHVLIAGDATATGESRKQAREGFRSSLLVTKPRVERPLRSLLETALAMAAYFSGQPGRFAGLRAVVECRVDAGARTADEQRSDMEAFDKGLLSQETAMARIGVEDVDAEQSRIEAEKERAMRSTIFPAKGSQSQGSAQEGAPGAQDAGAAGGAAAAQGAAAQGASGAQGG